MAFEDALKEAKRRELAGVEDWTAGLRRAVMLEAMDPYQRWMRQLEDQVVMSFSLPSAIVGAW